MNNGNAIQVQSFYNDHAGAEQSAVRIGLAGSIKLDAQVINANQQDAVVDQPPGGIPRHADVMFVKALFLAPQTRIARFE